MRSCFKRSREEYPFELEMFLVQLFKKAAKEAAFFVKKATAKKLL
jgi:hypothetical protein